MKAARNKIAEQAKQRDCTQRMETQLIQMSESVETFINLMYVIQSETARKPLSKTHSVLLQGKNSIFELMFELHKVTNFLNLTAITGDDDLSIILPQVRKALNHPSKENSEESEVVEDDN